MAAKKLSEITQGTPGASDFVVGVTSGNQDRLFPVTTLGGSAGDVNYYVATAGNGGSDSNPGSIGSPFLTIQHGLNQLAARIALQSGNGILNVGAGSFVGGKVPYCVGTGTVQIYGAGSGSTTITGVLATGDCFLLNQAFSPVFAINGCTIQPAGGAAINIEAPIFLALGDFIGGTHTDLIFDLTFSGFQNVIFASATGATINSSFGTTTAQILLNAGTFYNTFFLQGSIVWEDQLHWTVSVAGAGATSGTNWIRLDGECAYINVAGHSSWTVSSGTIGGTCAILIGGGAAFSQNGAGTLGSNFFPGSGFVCDAISGYDLFPFMQNATDVPTSGNFLKTGSQWALVKDTNGAHIGARYLAVNDGGTVYVKQIGRSINKQTGASFTMGLQDSDGRVEMNNAGANTFTVPQDSAFSPAAPGVGTEVKVTQTGAGVTTIAAGAGATVNNAGAISAQWGSVTLYKTAANTWIQTNV